MKEIYITDLDHTFLRTDLSISDFTRDVWNSCSKNAFMGIATARSYKKTSQFLKDISLNIPMILLDGALIATKEKKIIKTKFLSKETADTIIHIGAKVGIYPFVLSLADKNLNEVFSYSEILNPYQKKVIGRYNKNDNLQRDKNLKAMRENFKIVYMGEESLLRELENTLRSVFKDTIKYILAPEAYVGCYFLTLLNKDADKSHGIQTINEYIGFSLNNLTVFGDNHNDIGMFKLANKSVAVANAQPEVKKMADIVLTKTNDEDGVAHYIKGIDNEKQ